MMFASDNTGPVHPEVLALLAEANDGHAMPYGADPLMDEVRRSLRDIFEAPEAAIYLVATGTAANALALATLGQPWQTVFCTPVAHIHEDECNAPEFYSGGSKLTLVGHGDKMAPEDLRAAIDAQEVRGVHGPQRGPVSLTQATERGSVYSAAELEALAGVARDYGLPVHMDGARFANALVTQNATPADLSWRAGIDALSFGGTKNGLMGVEAVVLFDPARAWEFELRRKRGAHLFSKHRYLSAQMAAYLREDLWLRSARLANAKAARLADGLERAGAAFLHPVEANMIFASLPRATHRRLKAAGAVYHLWDGDLEGPDEDAPLAARFVCDWALPEPELDRFLGILADG